jgi:hypothetical protein
LHQLVDAYHKGRAALKPLQDAYFKSNKYACFVGAIYYGLYKEISSPEIEIVNQIASDYPEIRKWTYNIPCKHLDTEGGTISGVLIHLNDQHSRREISEKTMVEWLASVL